MRWAIQHKLPSKIIKFLLKNGANPHIKAADGFDACDIAKNIERYRDIKILTGHIKSCKSNSNSKSNFDNQKQQTQVIENLNLK